MRCGSTEVLQLLQATLADYRVWTLKVSRHGHRLYLG